VKHTKGPWTVHKDKEGRGYEIYGNAPAPGWGSLGHQEVCRINAKRHGAKRGMRANYTEHPDDEANARLIAAAPELLEALKKWQSANALGDAQILSEARIARDLAIAKVEAT
jgi:hypothetical protein